MRGILILVACSVMLAGCTASTRQGMDGQSSTVTAPGYFSQSFQANLKTTTETFTFANPTGTAHVSNSIQLSTGEVKLALKDASGQVVYDETFTAPSQGSSSTARASSPGTWTIEVTWILATGQGSITIVGA